MPSPMVSTGSKQPFADADWARCGQASVEFAIVLFAFLGLLAGLGALVDFAQSGLLADHARAGASHHVGGEAGAWADVLAY